MFEFLFQLFFYSAKENTKANNDVDEDVDVVSDYSDHENNNCFSDSKDEGNDDDDEIKKY